MVLVASVVLGQAGCYQPALSQCHLCSGKGKTNRQNLCLLSTFPSTSLKLHLDSAEYQMAVMWWLGLNTSDASPCLFCQELVLDPLGHHAASCRHGGDVVIQHNRLSDIFGEFCRQAHLSVRVEVGFGLSRDHTNTRPADVLVQDWARGSPVAFDITVTSSLTPATLRDASTSAGSAAYAAECRKHVANDAECLELGWRCSPLVVETFGHRGNEAQTVFFFDSYRSS